ncbi:ECF transporter S component [Lactococcus kimchii]|uniref:ECF transporter S component n=1 Tax=Lactococcus sp. S-13 TaxID=2507158 RepID=UPI001022FA27|nr:ECF transporter S component [Lactococcus sp. S-13]RZI48721.1 ECF transporter S component [Lactococcus sp. S-13]
MKKSKASDVAILAIFIAIMVVVQLFSQFVINVWPFPVKPTLLHVPVIIGSIVLGWRKGAFLGFIMGLISFVNATIVTTPTSFLFSPFQPVLGTQHGSAWALIIAFVPRILIGIFPYFVYKGMKNHFGAGLAAFVGTATNTILVLSAIFVFFGSVLNWSVGYLLSAIVATNSLTEVIIAVVLTAAIVPALEKSRNRF